MAFGRKRPRDPAETDSLAEETGLELSIPATFSSVSPRMPLGCARDSEFKAMTFSSCRVDDALVGAGSEQPCSKLGPDGWPDMQAHQVASPSMVQPRGRKQKASSSDISTMPSRPTLMCRPEKVWTAPVPGGALMRTFTGLGGFRFSGSLWGFSLSASLRCADLPADTAPERFQSTSCVPHAI